jgi:hypothetical protein
LELRLLVVRDVLSYSFKGATDGLLHLVEAPDDVNWGFCTTDYAVDRMASLMHLELGAVRGVPGIFVSRVGSSFHVVVEVRALHRHEVAPSVGPTFGVQEIPSGEQGGTFGGATPDVGVPAVKLLIQKFHGLALSGHAFVVPASSVVLQLQNVEGSALVPSFVDMDERQQTALDDHFPRKSTQG